MSKFFDPLSLSINTYELEFHGIPTTPSFGLFSKSFTPS